MNSVDQLSYWERVRTIKIRMSKVKKLIKNLKKIRTLKVFFKLSRTLKVTKMGSWSEHQKWPKWVVDQNIKSDKNHQLDQNVGNQNIKKNVKNFKSQKLSKKTFEVLIFLGAIGYIRTSCFFSFGLFSTQNLFDVLILPMASKKIRTSKVTLSILNWLSMFWSFLTP